MPLSSILDAVPTRTVGTGSLLSIVPTAQSSVAPPGSVSGSHGEVALPMVISGRPVPGSVGTETSCSSKVSSSS